MMIGWDDKGKNRQKPADGDSPEPWKAARVLLQNLSGRLAGRYSPGWHPRET